MTYEVEISKGIVTHPGRLGGEPTIRGTRIPAAMVARMMEGDNPMHPDDILESYPFLTYADIVNISYWAHR